MMIDSPAADLTARKHYINIDTGLRTRVANPWPGVQVSKADQGTGHVRRPVPCCGR